MPQVTAPDGTTKYVPGVYFDTQVRSNLPGPLPEFQIPVILGMAWEGHPYDADDKTETGEPTLGHAKFFGTAGACGESRRPEWVGSARPSTFHRNSSHCSCCARAFPMPAASRAWS